MHKLIPRKRHRSVSQIRELLGRYRSGGLSRAEFARVEGICLATLSRYLSIECALPDLAPRFLEVERGGCIPSVNGNQEGYRICFQDGLQLEVPRGFSFQEVAGLLSLVAGKGAR